MLRRSITFILLLCFLASSSGIDLQNTLKQAKVKKKAKEKTIQNKGLLDAALLQINLLEELSQNTAALNVITPAMFDDPRIENLTDPDVDDPVVAQGKIPDGWYRSGPDRNCNDGCQRLGLVCSKADDEDINHCGLSPIPKGRNLQRLCWCHAKKDGHPERRSKEYLKMELDYRLGDAFKAMNGQAWREAYNTRFPGSIATEYLTRNEGRKNYTLLAKIMKDRISQARLTDASSLAPDNALIVHLRLGDVCADLDLESDQWWEDGTDYLRAKLFYEQVAGHKGSTSLSMLVPANITEVVIVGSNAHCSHDRLDECRTKSDNYREKVASVFETADRPWTVSHRNGIKTSTLDTFTADAPDKDFTYLASAKYLTPGHGGFSAMAKYTVLLLGNVVTDWSGQLRLKRNIAGDSYIESMQSLHDTNLPDVSDIELGEDNQEEYLDQLN